MKQPNPQRRRSTQRIAGHAQEDHILDPYQHRQKLAEDTLCPECGAVFHGTRWQRSAAKKDAPQRMWPACRRTAAGFPAGIVILRGLISRSQREDLVGLVRHQEEAEKTSIRSTGSSASTMIRRGLVITTTDIHLPRRIGEAVKRAFHGALEIDFDENEYFVRVDWTLQP